MSAFVLVPGGDSKIRKNAAMVKCKLFRIHGNNAL